MDEQTTEIVAVKSENEVAEIVKQDLNEIQEKVQTISKNALSIKNQGGWDAFWNKSKNIQSLASYTNDMAVLHQKTINLLILLLNGTVRMKMDYNEIMETIEVLSKEESDVQTVAYLLELKKTIKIIKERNDFISDEFELLDKEIKKIQELSQKTSTKNNIKFLSMDNTIKSISEKMENLIKENNNYMNLINSKIEKLNEKNEEYFKDNTIKISNIENSMRNNDNSINNKMNVFQKKLKIITSLFAFILSGIIIYEIIKFVLR